MKRFFKRGKNEKGAVVLEAAISLPVFMFFIVTILSIVNICIAQSRIQIALNETAKEISEYSYFYSLTGLDEIQRINYDESSGTRDNLTNVLDGVSTVYGSLQSIATGVNDFDISDADFAAMEASIDAIKNDVQTIDQSTEDIGKTLETMLSDPKGLMVGLVRIGMNELVEEVKSQLAAAMTKALIQKNLVDRDGGNVDEYLMHLGIVDGLDGIDFTGSLVFRDGTDDIMLVAEYRLPVIQLLNNDIELHFVQSATTKAWKAVRTSGGSGRVVVSGGEPGTNPDDGSGNISGIVVNGETEPDSEEATDGELRVEEITPDGGETATTAGNEPDGTDVLVVVPAWEVTTAAQETTSAQEVTTAAMVAEAETTAAVVEPTTAAQEVTTAGNETSYGKSSLNSLKNTENFTDSAIEHIYEGQVNTRGKAVGYHYEGIEGTAGKIIPGTESPVNNFGVYKAQVEVDGIPKTANGGFSTFYSKDMSPQQVVDSINEAYINRVHVRGNTYLGITSTGMEIEMFLDKEGKIISAYPIY